MDPNSIEFKIDEAMEMDEADFLMVSSVEMEPTKEEIQNLETKKVQQKPFAADIEADELYENSRAIQIARHSKQGNGNWELEWDGKNLKKILLYQHYKGKKVICISIVGNARTGKSTMLNFWLCFLGKMERGEIISLLNEMNDNDLFMDFIDGFSWDSGDQTLTNGIWMWSKLFVIGEFVVILLDCEGANLARYGNEARDDSCLDAQYFSICGLASSILVFNIIGVPTKENLDSLLRYTKYGRVVNNIKSPFQNLFFLRRNCPSSETGVDMQSLAEFSKQAKYGIILKNSNVNVTCYKLPSPKKSIADSKMHKQDFISGKCTVKKVGREFIYHLVYQFKLMLSMNEQNEIDDKIVKSRMLEMGERHLFNCVEFYSLLKNIFETFKDADFTDPDDFPSLWSAKRAREAALYHLKIAVSNDERINRSNRLELCTINELFFEHASVALDIYKTVHWTCSEVEPGKENELRGKKEHFITEGNALIIDIQEKYNEFMKKNDKRKIPSYWILGAFFGSEIGGLVTCCIPPVQIATVVNLKNKK